MSLPISRNTTYAAGADIKAVDLNALQDCVIGGKHGALSLALGVSAFVVTSGTPTLSDDRYTGVGSYQCNLRLPVGTLINSVQWWFDRSGGGTMTFLMRRRTLLSTTAAVTVVTRSDSVTTGWRSDSDLPAYTTVAGESVWLSVSGTGAVNVFGGIVLSLQRP